MVPRLTASQRRKGIFAAFTIREPSILREPSHNSEMLRNRMSKQLKRIKLSRISICAQAQALLCRLLLSPALPWPTAMLPPPTKFNLNIGGGALWPHQWGRHAKPIAYLCPPASPNKQGLQTRDQHPGGTRARGVSTGCTSIWDGARRKQTPMGLHPWGVWWQKWHFPITALWVLLPKRTSDVFTELFWAPPANTRLQWSSCGPWWMVMNATGSNLTSPYKRKSQAFSSVDKKKPLLKVTKLFSKSHPGASSQPAGQVDRALMSIRGSPDTPLWLQKNTQPHRQDIWRISVPWGHIQCSSSFRHQEGPLDMTWARSATLQGIPSPAKLRIRYPAGTFGIQEPEPHPWTVQAGISWNTSLCTTGSTSSEDAAHLIPFSRAQSLSRQREGCLPGLKTPGKSSFPQRN